jgi:hypothetical protein
MRRSRSPIDLLSGNREKTLRSIKHFTPEEINRKMGRKTSLSHCSPAMFVRFLRPRLTIFLCVQPNSRSKTGKQAYMFIRILRNFHQGIDEPFLAGNRSIYPLGYADNE